MVHNSALLDQLDALPRGSFEGLVYRVTRQSLEPNVTSKNGGRWMPKGGAGVLYTALESDGALAEVSFHLSQITPPPSKPLTLHCLKVNANPILRLLRADLTKLGVPEAELPTINYARTQEIGAAVEFLGFDGLIAPSARWKCDNLILFPDRPGSRVETEVISSNIVDWNPWATARGFL